MIDIDKLAKLSRLNLTDVEKATITPQIESILAYVGKLAEVDTSGVSPAAYITDAKNVFRSDEINNCDQATRDRLIEAFPKKVGVALSVPGIFEERTE